jgi:nucleotide-binding universal stress UspA family protein
LEDDILVAIDGSKHSTAVIDVATEIAKGMSLKILLVHVLKTLVDEDEGLLTFEKAEEYKDAYADYVQQYGQQLIEEFSHKIEQGGVSFRSVTPSGNPAGEIIEIARLEKVKMLVIGMKGHHGIGRIISLGSVARRVVENSPCPVVVVPGEK